MYGVPNSRADWEVRARLVGDLKELEAQRLEALEEVNKKVNCQHKKRKRLVGVLKSDVRFIFCALFLNYLIYVG